MSDREPTCHQRIRGELNCRLEEYRDALRDDEKRDEVFERILSLSSEIVFTLELSTGGPADGFRFYADPKEKEITKVEYYFQDWFDGAELLLTDEDRDTLLELFGELILTYL
jgi:hypothetical protein